MELMLAILLFSLAAAICVQVFVKSHMISEQSTNLNYAVLASTSVAEILRSSGDSAEILSKEYPFSESDTYTTHIFYDSDWVPTTKEVSCFTLSVAYTQEKELLTADISVYQNQSKDTLIYSLEVVKHIEKEDISR
jgi:hypothetical protein